MISHLFPKRAISPAAAVTNDTPLVSQIIDRQGFDALSFLIATGDLADAGATFTVLVEHDDAAGFGTATAVPDEDLVGTEARASFTQADDNKCFMIGYQGIKRYVRLTITPAGNAANAFISAIALLGKPTSPNFLPASNPPA
jgi:hypothetical protein